MKEEYCKWYSPNLSQDIEMLVFGHQGIPVLLFPTSGGRFFQNKDFGLVGSAAWAVDSGLVKLYCIDSIDTQSWYNKQVHPAQRVANHGWYDRMLRHELLPRAQHETGHARVAVGGCSFGAYHATNFAFRYPSQVAWLFNMGGAFDIRSRLDGFFNEDAYFHNPVDYVRDLSDPSLHHMGMVFGVGEHDFCRPANEAMASTLYAKGITYWLDIVPGYSHDWDAWLQMFPRYISEMLKNS